MNAKTKPVPEGFHTVTPEIAVKDSMKAIEFYQKAFGAQELSRYVGPGGKIMHAEIKIGSSIVMMCDEMPEMKRWSADSLKGSPIHFFLYLENVDAAFDRAVKAGCKAVMPVDDMFWGDRCGSVEDPFGFRWMIATHKEDLTPEETKKRGEEFFSKAMAASRK